MNYANSDFDRAQALAFKLTEADRQAGRDAPAAGYSEERFAEAAVIVGFRKQVKPHIDDVTSIFGPTESDSIHENTVCIR